MSTTHTIHALTLSAGLAADCPRCRQIVANGEATSPGFDDLPGEPGTPEKAAAAQRLMLGNTATMLREVAAHMPDTVTRITQNIDASYSIRIGYSVTPQDVADLIDSAAEIAGHWAANIRREPDGATIITEHDGDYGPNGHGAHIVTMRQIAEAIAGILDGSHTVSPDILRNLREYVAALDYCDPETGDAVLQIAALGEITYG